MSDTPPRDPHELLLERNRLNLVTGLRMARPMVNAVRAGDNSALRAASESIVFNFLTVLDRDALEQLTLTCLINLAGKLPTQPRRPPAGSQAHRTAFPKLGDHE